MPQSTFANPVVLPEVLNAAERKFVRCMAEGNPCVIGESRPAEAIDDGKNANVIRADVIRFFVWGGSEHNSVAGNTIDLRGAFVKDGLNLKSVISRFSLSLTDCCFQASAPVTMSYAVLRFVNLSGSFLPLGLEGDGVLIESDLAMEDGFCAEGEVRLLGAEIGGGLYCNRGTFINKEGSSLAADGISVKGGVFMKGEFCAEGEVRFLGAVIGQDMDCESGQFKNKNGIALSADRIKIGGNVFLHDNFCADGMVRFPSAIVNGHFVCDGGKIKNKNGNALDAQGIKVEGNFSLRNGFRAEGDVVLFGADINGGLYCNDGEFKDGFNARAAKIRNSLLWKNVKGGGTVNFSFAIIGVLVDDEKSRASFHFRLNGFSYQQFDSLGDVKSRIENWLDNRPKGSLFSPQPFEQAAKVLFAMGYNNDAQAVLWAKEKRLTEEGELPDWHKPARKIWDWLAGYGYRLRRTLGAAGLIIGFGWAVFAGANYYGHIVPHQPVVLKMMQESDKVKDSGDCAGIKPPTRVVECLLPEHPKFYSLAYSLDVFIPFFALHQEPYWYPQPQNPDKYLVRWALIAWYWIEIIAGWVLTSLLVLTITGLLKPRQTSGKE